MKYDAELINRILQEYEDIRALNRARHYHRIDEVYNKVPRIKEIDDETRAVGSSVTANILANPDKSQEYKAKMKESFARLRAEKEQLLAENGFSSDYMDMVYTCSMCEDTGYIGGARCRCFEQKLINEAYMNSNLMMVIKEQNFERFSFDYYNDTAIEPDGVSPLSRIKDIYAICRKFSADFENYPKSLLFYGGSGLGKTFLSSCIAKEVLDSGKTVIYTGATRLFSLYEDYKFGRTKADSMIEKSYETDLLIIDDLGTEFRSKATEPFLFDLMNSRLLNGKKLIISTNYNMNELTSIYSTRFTSRVYEFFTPLKFLGEDIRVKKCVNNID